MVAVPGIRAGREQACALADRISNRDLPTAATPHAKAGRPQMRAVHAFVRLWVKEARVEAVFQSGFWSRFLERPSQVVVDGSGPPEFSTVQARCSRAAIAGVVSPVRASGNRIRRPPLEPPPARGRFAGSTVTEPPPAVKRSFRNPRLFRLSFPFPRGKTLPIPGETALPLRDDQFAAIGWRCSKAVM